MSLIDPATRLGDTPRSATDDALPARDQRNARLVLVTILLALGLWTIREFLPALAWATVLAIAIWPLYERAQRRWPSGKHNVLLPSLFTVAIALLFGLPLVILVIQGAREAQDVVALYNKATSSGIPVPDFVSHLPFGAETVTQWWQDHLTEPVQKGELMQRVNRSSVIEIGRNVGRDLVHRVVLFFFALMTLFILLKEGEGLVDDLLKASHKMFGPRGERVARQVVASVHGTVDGLVLVGLAEGVLMGIAYIVAGVPHPTLLGGLTAVAAMIPFAVTLVFILVGALLVAQGAVVSAIVVIVLGSVMAFLADHLVRPVLIGGTTRLPFIWVLFGILGGVETWGLLGLFVGPALMAALILLWREFTDPEAVERAKPAA